jgi:DNA-3-methyladenine glycosylase
VAPDLLNKILSSRGADGTIVSGRIIEVEAYDESDPASHSFGRRTPRNEVMFGRGGHLYVYLSYGIHCCANVVAGRAGDGAAVLIRAVEPVSGLDTMRARRGPVHDRDLVNGPGKVCQALGIGLADYGVDLTAPPSRIVLIDDGTTPPDDPLVGPRIGITRAVEVPWRFRVPAPVT